MCHLYVHVYMHVCRYVHMFLLCCTVEQKSSYEDEEINSYYKVFPMFENLNELQKCWVQEGIHDMR